MSPKSRKWIFLLVQISTVCVFLGRAWQHIVWDAPYRTLLWDEEWMTTILEWLSSITFEEFITNMKMDDTIQSFIKGVGWFYVLCALMSVFIKKIPKALTYFLWVGAVSLMFLAFLYCKDKFFQWGQFWEYSLQFGSPVFLFYLNKNDELGKRLFLWIKIAIAVTFASHALYALNYYPRPGHFTEMVINIFGVSEQTALLFLNVAGWLDLVVAIGIFIPGRVAKVALIYAIIWGLATTLARIWGHFYMDMIGDTLSQWVHESVYRFPHFLIPLAALFFEKEK